VEGDAGGWHPPVAARGGGGSGGGGHSRSIAPGRRREGAPKEVVKNFLIQVHSYALQSRLACLEIIR
jgi:hypothetical protein